MATNRVSVTAGGVQGNQASSFAAVSDDGTRVAFVSQASNLVPGDTNGYPDVFLKDLTTGALTRVSTAADGAQTFGFVGSPRLSGDGTRLAFTSDAPTLVAGDTNNQQDVFVKDLGTGAITRVSTATDGTEANSFSANVSFSRDGSTLAFVSDASNLVAGDTNGQQDIFVRNLATGVLTRASTASDGTQADNLSNFAALSGNGSRIAFASSAGNLVAGDTNNRDDIFVKDLGTGAVRRISTAADGTQGNDTSARPSISADGTRVVFQSNATNLVAGDTNGTSDIFLADLTAGTLTRVSTAGDGGQGNGLSQDASISADGTRVIFESLSTNLVAGDTNGTFDVFVKDLATGAVTRVSTAGDGTQADGASLLGGLSGNGSRAVFQSAATNLVAGDTNNRQDVFIADVPVCFVTGTRIRTARGEVAVEDLAVGDLVVTADGAHRPIRWIGTRTIDCRRHAEPAAVLPVRIAAHAFGETLPARDLRVSPGHSLAVDLLGEVLIPAYALVNGTTIVQVTVARVTYWHVELDSHDVILAEGLAAESYLDMGNRGFFLDGGVVTLHTAPDADPSLRSHADFCRPFHAGGPLVDLVRARLAERADAIGAETQTPRRRRSGR